MILDDDDETELLCSVYCVLIYDEKIDKEVENKVNLSIKSYDFMGIDLPRAFCYSHIALPIKFDIECLNFFILIGYNGLFIASA